MFFDYFPIERYKDAKLYILHVPLSMPVNLDAGVGSVLGMLLMLLSHSVKTCLPRYHQGCAECLMLTRRC